MAYILLETFAIVKSPEIVFQIPRGKWYFEIYCYVVTLMSFTEQFVKCVHFSVYFTMD